MTKRRAPAGVTEERLPGPGRSSRGMRREDLDGECGCYRGSVALAAREVSSLSREERSHEGSEESSDPAGSANEAVECATVIATAWTFLDGECTDDTRAWVSQHLGACEGCLSQYALEARIKNLIATTCKGDAAPERLRQPR